jgi:hypothetical protein
VAVAGERASGDGEDREPGGSRVDRVAVAVNGQVHAGGQPGGNGVAASGARLRDRSSGPWRVRQVPGLLTPPDTRNPAGAGGRSARVAARTRGIRQWVLFVSRCRHLRTGPMGNFCVPADQRLGRPLSVLLAGRWSRPPVKKSAAIKFDSLARRGYLTSSIAASDGRGEECDQGRY